MLQCPYITGQLPIALANYHNFSPIAGVLYGTMVISLIIKSHCTWRRIGFGITLIVIHLIDKNGQLLYYKNFLIIVLYKTPLMLDPILHVNQNGLIIVYLGIAFGHYHINMLFLMK